MVVELKEQKNGLTEENRRRLDAHIVGMYLVEWDRIPPESRTVMMDTLYLGLPEEGKQAVLREWARLSKEQKNGR